MPFLIAGYTDTLPADFDDTEFVLLAHGFEEHPEPAPIPLALVRYQIAFVSPEAHLDRALACIRGAWGERYGTPLTLELIESRASHLIRKVRKQLPHIPPEHFSMRAPVAFRRDSPHARALAIESITRAFTRKPWQFWL
jgi:hypothetical protein